MVGSSVSRMITFCKTMAGKLIQGTSHKIFVTLGKITEVLKNRRNTYVRSVSDIRYMIFV